MPDLIIIAGPNGSGKSTIFPAINSVEKDLWAFEPEKVIDSNFINADNIAKELRLSDFSAGRVEIEAIRGCIQKNVSFAIETTLSGKSLLNYLKIALEKKYRIYIVFVFVDSPELSMVRVTQRALLGKHYIPMNNILLRFPRSFINFYNHYKQLADFWIMVNNSTLILSPVCWGGNIFQFKELIQCENINSLIELNSIFETNKIGLKVELNNLSCDDVITKKIISKIQVKIQKDLESKPSGTYISVSNQGKVEFIKFK